MNKYKAMIAGVALLAVPSLSSAAVVTLTGIDDFGTSSFNTAGTVGSTNLNWDNGLAPSAGNDYFVPDGTRLRTPADGGSYVFAGDSLTINNTTPYGDGLMYKGTGSSGTLTIDNLIFDGGLLSHANGSGDICNLDGAITVAAGGARLYAKQGPVNILASVSGSADITVPAPDSSYYVTFLSAASTFTGNIIDNGYIALATNAVMNFVIGANGVNNSISGTGTASFEGDFVFDLTGAGTTLGDSWTIASVASQTFTTNFMVSGFLDNGDGTWYLDNGTGKYKFYENTGMLQVVSGNIIPITVSDLIPADGSEVFESQPDISITLIDGSVDAVLPGTIAMTVNGGGVTPGVSSGGGSHVVTYSPPAPFAAGPVNVVVTYDDDNANSYTNSWSFNIHATTTEKLWNINIAGAFGEAQSNVTDGVIAVAPSSGANMWNNVFGVNNGNNTATNDFSDMMDANGGNLIGFRTFGSQFYGNADAAAAVNVHQEMFQGWVGANAPMDMTGVIYNLNPANAYDIYIYSTWRWTQNTVDYEIVEGYANVTTGSIAEVQANVQNDATNDYSGCVEGENYIIFHSVTPTASGRIAFTGKCSDGVLSGLQVLEIPGAASRPDLQVDGSDPSDGAIFVESTPTLTAYFVDVDGTVDTGTISMTVDGNPVPHSYSHSSTTSSVSFTVTAPFAPMSTHTAKVVLQSNPNAESYTNEWSFKVAPVAGNIVYVDATTNNTAQWNGSSFVTFNPDGAAGNWTTRTVFGNGGQVYQSLDGTRARLKTTVSGLADAIYDVYAYMWVQGNDWRIEAALTNNLAGEIPLYKRTDYPANTQLSGLWADYDPANTWGDWGTPAINPYYSTNLVVNPFAADDVMVAEADRRMMQIYLGQVSGTEITVYVDDDVTGDDRTWYDGIGYEEYTGGPSFAPVIQSISVAGGSVTMTWTSESVATYSILRKASLTDAIWTPVKTSIAGGDPTTTDSVSVGGTDEEFYQIKGE